MKKKFNKKTVITFATALCGLALFGGISTSVQASAKTEGLQTLDGFQCAGASVNAEELGMRFVFNLSGEEALAKQQLTAGVVYMPYDLYSGDMTDFGKDTARALTTTFAWQDNAATVEDKTDMVGYTYLDAEVIPPTMYNRTLLVRGYIEDGDNVYYTAPVRASMAHSAWKGLEVLGSTYESTLKTYMGPYTLTSEAGNIGGLYYGDLVTGLPTTHNGKNIANWYWDEEMTDKISATDYATGSMPIYFAYEKFLVSGTVSGVEDLASVKIKVVGGADVGVVNANGNYSIALEAGTYDLCFYNDNYIAYVKDLDVTENTTQDVALVDNTWAPGSTGTATGYDMMDVDGTISVSGAGTLVTFPNAATTGDFIYEANISGMGDAASRKDLGIGICSGTYSLSVSFPGWDQIYVNLNTSAQSAYSERYAIFDFKDANANLYHNNTKIRLVRTGTEIACYISSSYNYNDGAFKLYFTLTKDGIVLPTETTQKSDNGLISNWAWTAGFFAEGAKLVPCIANGVTGNATATYMLSIAKYAQVTGMITANETVDLTKTTLTVDGVATNCTINADGSYTASVPAGEHTLAFVNGAWGATVKKTILNNAANTFDITLVDYTWAPGTFGTVGGTTGFDATDIDGEITVSGVNQRVVFPNTATTGDFSYEAKFTSISRGHDASLVGIGITNGTVTLSVTFVAWEHVVVNLNTVGTNSSIERAISFDLKDAQQFNATNDPTRNPAIRLVRQGEEIQCYIKRSYGGEVLYFTITKDGFKLANDVSKSSLLQGDEASLIEGASGLFAKNANLCATINLGLNRPESTSATYALSITK